MPQGPGPTQTRKTGSTRFLPNEPRTGSGTRTVSPRGIPGVVSDTAEPKKKATQQPEGSSDSLSSPCHSAQSPPGSHFTLKNATVLPGAFRALQGLHPLTPLRPHQPPCCSSSLQGHLDSRFCTSSPPPPCQCVPPPPLDLHSNLSFSGGLPWPSTQRCHLPTASSTSNPPSLLVFLHRTHHHLKCLYILCICWSL